MADNVPITAGAGTTIATDDVSNVHFQRVKLVDGTLDGTDAIPGTAANGLDVDVTRVQGSVTVIDGGSSLTVDNGGTFAVQPTTVPTLPTWVVSSGNTIHVAAARTTLLDLFNASGSGVVLKVRGIFVIPALAAVTGVGQTYEVIRTSAVGTGGSGATPQKYDSASSALPAQVTARTKPTGGATTAATLLYLNGSSEETNPYAAMASQLNHVAAALANFVEPLVLREGEGIKVDQTTSSSVGNVNIVVVFTVG